MKRKILTKLNIVLGASATMLAGCQPQNIPTLQIHYPDTLIRCLYGVPSDFYETLPQEAPQSNTSENEQPALPAEETPSEQ